MGNTPSSGYGKYPRLVFRIHDSEHQTTVVILRHCRFKWCVSVNLLQGWVDEGPLHLCEVIALLFR